MARGPVSVGDLMTALAQLEIRDDATRRVVAESLGLTWDPVQVAARETPAPEPAPPPPARPQVVESGSTHHYPTGPEVSRSDTAPEPLASRLVQTRFVHRQTPAFVDRAEPLERPGDRPNSEPPKHLPLFDPNYTRSILAIALSAEEGRGRLDLDRVVSEIARGRTFSRLPLRWSKTLARGVQLLLDHGPAMLPYREDLRQIEAAICRVGGQHQTRVLRFEDCPGRGIAGDDLELEDYWTHHRPPAATPVICVTDLGVGRPRRVHFPATAAEWLDFAAGLRRAGCPLLVLSPHAPSRLPTKLAEALPVLHWSRKTRARAAARLIGDRRT